MCSQAIDMSEGAEEKVMNMDIAAPPLFLIGMEGFWGVLTCVLVLYPCAYYMEGNDHEHSLKIIGVNSVYPMTKEKI